MPPRLVTAAGTAGTAGAAMRVGAAAAGGAAEGSARTGAMGRTGPGVVGSRRRAAVAGGGAAAGGVSATATTTTSTFPDRSDAHGRGSHLIEAPALCCYSLFGLGVYRGLLPGPFACPYSPGPTNT